MTDGWLLSLFIANLPTMALVIFIGHMVFDGRKNLREEWMLALFGLPFFVAILSIVISIVSLVSTILLFPAVFSVVNVILLIVDCGLSVLRDEINSGLMSLRVCSVISLGTFVKYFRMVFAPAEKEFSIYQAQIDQLHDKHDFSAALAGSEYHESPAKQYSKITKSAGHFGNFFFLSVILSLWIQVLLDLETIWFPITSYVLFFIIDDWALLIHFKLYSATAVTDAHRYRLYVATLLIVLLTILTAVDINELLLYVSAFFVALSGILSYTAMTEEKSRLETFKNPD